MNPVAVLGPALGPDTSHSVGIIKQLLGGGMPGCPKVYSPYVDVRDVAALHLLAMEHPAAKGERFIAAAPGTYSLADRAQKKKPSEASPEANAHESGKRVPMLRVVRCTELPVTMAAERVDPPRKRRAAPKPEGKRTKHLKIVPPGTRWEIRDVSRIYCVASKVRGP